MLRLLAVLNAVLGVSLGLAIAITRGGIYGRFGLPAPLPFHADLLAVFLVAIGAGFIPAVLDPPRQRPYLWIFGVGVKVVAASLFARLWVAGLVGWATGVAALGDAVLGVLMMLALFRR